MIFLLMTCYLVGGHMVDWHVRIAWRTRRPFSWQIGEKLLGLIVIVGFYQLIMHLGGTKMPLTKGEVEKDEPPRSMLMTPTQV